MEYEEFVSAVQGDADLSRTEAESAIAATLTTLSERVPDGDARDVAEQLPHEVGEHLTTADGRDSFGYDEFVTRVAEREDRDIEERASAERDAQAVVATLLDAVASRTTDDLLTYLTADYEPLLALVEPEEVWGPGWRDRLGEQG